MMISYYIIYPFRFFKKMMKDMENTNQPPYFQKYISNCTNVLKDGHIPDCVAFLCLKFNYRMMIGVPTIYILFKNVLCLNQNFDLSL